MRVKGFSLIELMIVIGIIAVINMIMYPNFASLQQTAKEISAKSSARSLMIALEQYFFIHQTYPPGSNISISSIIPILHDNQCLRSGSLTNPYTSQPYSVSDASGQVLYDLVSSNSYTIKGYGQNNEELVFEYP
tara:strand:- start:1256 stop:1657 length:402 start_codon:yes stop_codon:yes gene_type:complete